MPPTLSSAGDLSYYLVSSGTRLNAPFYATLHQLTVPSATALGAFVWGPPIGFALGWGRLRSEPGVAIQDRAYRLRESASQVRFRPPTLTTASH
jgi:hypothetical protein